MKVLLPTDFSESTEDVIKAVERRAWPADTEVTILHVVNTLSVSSGWVDLSPYLEAQTESAKRMTEEAGKRLSAKGLKVSEVVRCGYPPVVIANYADKWIPDLVIVGSHGLGAVARFLLGSVAKSVLQGTHGSVEIARGAKSKEFTAPMKILVATDGSSYSEAAAKSVAEIPWPKGTVVEVLAVAEAAQAVPDPWFTTGQIAERLHEERLEAAKESALRAAEILSGAGIKPLSKVVSGYPKSAILDEAKEFGADLIVVGSHGRHGLKRLLLGSVAEVVALYSPCSVEVIRGHNGSVN